jgi:hypothetical protein
MFNISGEQRVKAWLDTEKEYEDKVHRKSVGIYHPNELGRKWLEKNQFKYPSMNIVIECLIIYGKILMDKCFQAENAIGAQNIQNYAK